MDIPSRGFFGRKSKPEAEKKSEEAASPETEETAATEETKEQAAVEESKSAEAPQEGKQAREGKDSSTSSSGSDSSDKEGEEEQALSAKDVKRIKQLFNEQEAEIKSLEKQLKDLEEESKKKIEELEALSKRKDNEIKLARIEYTKQVKENEATVVRYRKMIEDEKEFAITKFAKDLLEVRDAVRMAIEHTDMEAVAAEEDLQAVKDRFTANMEGQAMNAQVMDKVLERFKVTQYDPKGQKFDPQLHEAVFTVAQSENENDTVEIVMQTGWKIGDRILRAAKVGIVKKS